MLPYVVPSKRSIPSYPTRSRDMVEPAPQLFEYKPIIVQQDYQAP